MRENASPPFASQQVVNSRASLRLVECDDEAIIIARLAQGRDWTRELTAAGNQFLDVRAAVGVNASDLEGSPRDQRFNDVQHLTGEPAGSHEVDSHTATLWRMPASSSAPARGEL